MEVDRPRKLVFTWIGPLTNNVNTLVTVELNPRGDETDLVLTHERLPTPAIREGHTKGWGNILGHLADGLSNVEIARKCWITENTVKFHLKNLFRKLAVRDRGQAMMIARDVVRRLDYPRDAG